MVLLAPSSRGKYWHLIYPRKQADRAGADSPSAAKEGEWPATELSSFTITALIPLLSSSQPLCIHHCISSAIPMPPTACSHSGREKPISELPEGKGQEATEVRVFHCSSLHYNVCHFLSGVHCNPAVKPCLLWLVHRTDLSASSQGQYKGKTCRTQRAFWPQKSRAGAMTK